MYEKTLPTTITGLRVPNPEYAYFEHAERFPLEAAPGLDFRTAWWLAEISFLIYLPDPNDVTRRLSAAGFAGTAFFEREGTRALVTGNADHLIIAFRGTDIRDARNLVTDADFLPTRFHASGRVHRGFLAALEAVSDDILSHIERTANGRRVLFTGHSLGAALATLLARLSPVGGALYTFGSPRVGDRAFGDAFTTPAYRFIHHTDIVTMVPPPVVFHHVGRPVILTADGRHAIDMNSWGRLKLRFETRLRERFQEGGFAAGRWKLLLTENALADHAPIGYAIAVWNALLRGPGAAEGEDGTPGSVVDFP